MWGERHWSLNIPVNMETMVQQGCDFVGTPQLNHEEWAASLYGGEHEVIDRNAFATASL